MNRNRIDKIFSADSLDKVADDLKIFVDFQEEGLPLQELSGLIDEKLLPHLMHYDRPEFQSFYNFFPEEGAEFGGKIALSYNQGVTNWQVSPGGAMLEELCCKALCRLFGLSPSADATFMYCGTYANQQALYLALHRKAEQQGFDLAEKGLQGFEDLKRLAVITSREAHLSILHALRILGLGERSLVFIPVDSFYRIDAKRMCDAIYNMQKTKDIFCVVATAGSISTGSIDPILPIVNICQELNIWLHIDGAYGFAFSLLPEYKDLFSGIEYADSITWDPHKQFGVPIPNSLLFVRNKKDFNRMAIYGEYFNRKDDIAPNPGLKSPPTTRPFSALPLVTSMRSLGMTRIRERLRAPLRAIKAVAKHIERKGDIELCHQPDTGVLCLRVIPQDFPEKELDLLQQFIYERIKKEGKRSISITKLDNKTVLRLVAITPSVTERALMETISAMRTLAKEYPE
jgi:glutamate/tyrosine decarboxylase-like PLP-dependent enzyme